jgi:hypothetical protein
MQDFSLRDYGVYATFNNMWVISRRSVLLVEETGGPGENHEALLIPFSQRLLNYLAFKSFDYEAPPKEQIVSDLRQIGGFLRVLRI